MITYTGHPFVDTGFAVITAFVRKRRFADLTGDDCPRMNADYSEAERRCARNLPFHRITGGRS
jgi:hypothetical protein